MQQINFGKTSVSSSTLIELNQMGRGNQSHLCGIRYDMCMNMCADMCVRTHVLKSSHVYANVFTHL